MRSRRLNVRYRGRSLESERSQSRFPFASHSGLNACACYQPSVCSMTSTCVFSAVAVAKYHTRARREAKNINIGRCHWAGFLKFSRHHRVVLRSEINPDLTEG